MAAKNATTKTKKTKPQAQDFELMTELFTRLMEASLNSHYSEVKKAGSEFAKELSSLGYDSQAKRLSSLLRKKAVPLRASGQVESLPVDTKSRLPLVEEMGPPDTPLFLGEEESETFNRLISDAQNSHLLSEKGLSSPLCMLLSGPPGTGKTLLAHHVAAQLKRPFYVARLDAVISSLLGETAKNIRAVFDFIPHKDAVLLLDEIDAVAKMRDDKHELGEVKRVVNTLIQGLDSIDDQTVVIGATNHPHLLDQAIWRRFPYKIELNKPDSDTCEEMWRYFLFEDKDPENIAHSLALISEGLSGADIQEIAYRVRRRSVLDKQEIDPAMVCQLIMKNFQKPSLVGSSFTEKEHEKKQLTQFMCDEKGLTQIEAARLLGITRQTIASYLKGASHG